MKKKRRDFIVAGILKMGTLVSEDTAKARLAICAGCKYNGMVNPVSDLVEEGCTKCGCLFATKPLMKTFLFQTVECPHEDGDKWNFDN